MDLMDADIVPWCCNSWLVVGALVLAAIVGFLFMRCRNKKFHLDTSTHQQNVVYLFQFPRCTLGPNPSPFCIKLEIFLRVNEIEHTVCGSRKTGPRGKLPFIAYNGEVISDSDNIVKFLIREFNLSLDEWLGTQQRATGHVVQRMLEENTYWTGVHYRWVQTSDRLPYVFSNQPSLLQKLFFRYVLAGRVSKSLYAQGTGRHTVAEIADITQQDLRSVAGILGKKEFLLGDRITSYDCAAFGMLSVALWEAPGSVHESLMNTELQTLRDYCQRIRDRWMSDWDELAIQN